MSTPVSPAPESNADAEVLLIKAIDAAPLALPEATARLVVRELRNGLWWLGKFAWDGGGPDAFERMWGAMAREVAALPRRDADTPLAERLQDIADQVPPCLPEPVAAQLARHLKAAGQILSEIEWMRAGTPGGDER